MCNHHDPISLPNRDQNAGSKASLSTRIGPASKRTSGAGGVDSCHSLTGIARARVCGGYFRLAPSKLPRAPEPHTATNSPSPVLHMRMRNAIVRFPADVSTSIEDGGRTITVSSAVHRYTAASSSTLQTSRGSLRHSYHPPLCDTKNGLGYIQFVSTRSRRRNATCDAHEFEIRRHVLCRISPLCAQLHAIGQLLSMANNSKRQ